MSKLQSLQLHCALLALLLSTATVLAASRPNILFIMSDDHASQASVVKQLKKDQDQFQDLQR